MPPSDRYDFIIKYLEARGLKTTTGTVVPYTVDCLDSNFVDKYIDHTGANFQPVTLGAHRCNQLARDLANMTKSGLLVRWRSGIEGMGWGWPKWVWCYQLAEKK